MADGPGGLVILDVSAPRLPKEVGRYQTKGFTHHVSKGGNYAYLANREFGLLIIKVEDPANPTLEASYLSDSWCYASHKEDVYVFISTDTKTEILRHNNKPILEPVADFAIDENTPYTLQLKAYDPDGDDIYFEAYNLPEGSLFDTKTGLFSWAPTYEQSGLYSGVIFKVIEKTASKLSDAVTVNITVNHVNRQPELPAIANVEIAEDSLFILVVPEGSDPDIEDAGNLTYRIENFPEGVSFDSTSRKFVWKPGFEQSGTFIIDFVLEDGAGGADREAVNFTVTHVDRPPVVDKIDAQNTSENQTLTLSVSGTEADNEDLDKVSFSLFNLPEGATFDAAKKQLTWTPGFAQSGTYDNIGVVMKAGNLSDTTYFSVTVTHINRPPALNVISAQQVNENEALTFSISGLDSDSEDSGQLIYQAENLPIGAVFNADSLTVKWTPTYEQSGVFENIQFTVTDPQGLSDQKTIAITVNHVNRPPVLSEIVPMTTAEDSMLSFQLTASDPDQEDAGKLVFSAANLPEGATLDASTGQLSWKPTYEQSGEYTVTLTVSDGTLSDSKQTSITVTHVNRPPVLNEIAEQTVNENTPLSFTLSGDDPDQEDAGKLTYTAQNLPAGSDFNPGSQTFSWTPGFEQAAVYTNVTFRISDANGLSDEKPARIVVVHVNRKPELTAVPAQSVGEQQPVNFTLQGTDPDQEDEGKLQYTISNLPEGATLAAETGAFSWTPTFDQSGTYTLNAQVADSVGLASDIEISLEITNVNRPPVVETMPAQTGQENQPLTINLLFSDPDKEDEGKLQVSAQGLPEGAVLDASSGVITWTPTFDQSGEYTIDYTITDSFGETATGNMTVQIENVNREPSLTAVDALGINENEVLATTLPEAQDPDQEDAGKLAYSLENLPDGASFNPTTRSFQWTPRFDQAGNYTLTYTVTDQGGLSAQISVSLTVNNVNRAPTLPQVENMETQEGSNFSQQLPEANEPDQDEIPSLKYEVQNLPDGANFDAGSRTIRWTPDYNKAGSYNLSYSVTDPSGETAEVSFSITVQNTNRNPSINSIGDKSVKEGKELSFKVAGDDPDEEDKNNLSISADGMPAGANFSGGSGNFSWIPRDNQQGNYRVTFTIRDPQGGSAQTSVSITVEDVPPPAPPQ